MAGRKTTFDKIYSNMKTRKKTKVALQGEYFDGIEIDVTETLNLDDALAFCAYISNACANIGEAEYTPEAFPFAMNMGILEFYAGMKLPEDSNKIYRVVTETDLINQILPHINTDQLEDIRKMAMKRIEYCRDMLTATGGARTTELLERVSTVIANTERMMSSLSDIDFESALTKLTGMAAMTPEVTAEVEKKIIEMKPRKTSTSERDEN